MGKDSWSKTRDANEFILKKGKFLETEISDTEGEGTWPMTRVVKTTKRVGKGSLHVPPKQTHTHNHSQEAPVTIERCKNIKRVTVMKTVHKKKKQHQIEGDVTIEIQEGN